MRDRNGQFEIMGLAVIVVIIIFAILLALMFMKPSDVNSTSKDLTDSTLASNMVNVILKTTLNCKDIDLKSLLQDCAEGVTTKEYCSADDKDACKKVTGIINNSILQKTLTVWKRNYTFRASVIGESDPRILITNTPIVSGSPTCGGKLSSQKYASTITESFPIPLKDGRLMELGLSICR